jgi:hypothetical protein
MPRYFLRLVLLLGVAALLAAFAPGAAPATQASTSGVVISAIYTRGGSTGATYTHKYAELFNAGNTAVNITGWTIRYASATATTWPTSGANVFTFGTVTLQPGQYYLVQGGSNGSNGVALPSPDATSSLNSASAGGKYGLFSDAATCNTDTAVGCGSYVDFVGYGTANASETAPGAAQGLTQMLARKDDGCTDTDDNSADFELLTASARNSGTTLAPCSTGIPECTGIAGFPYTLPSGTLAQLRQAILCANANGTSADEINLGGATVNVTSSYADYGGATGLPQITTPITIRNGTINRPSGGGNYRLLAISSAGDLTLRDVTVSGGFLGIGANGGAILSNGTLTIRNSTLTNNNATDGGAIHHGNTGILSILNSTLSSNSGSLGSAIFSNGVTRILSSTISGNTASTAYAIVASSSAISALEIRNTVISGNVGGAALYMSGSGTKNLFNITMSGNYAATGTGTFVADGSGVSSNLLHQRCDGHHQHQHRPRLPRPRADVHHPAQPLDHGQHGGRLPLGGQQRGHRHRRQRLCVGRYIRRGRRRQHVRTSP